MLKMSEESIEDARSFAARVLGARSTKSEAGRLALSVIDLVAEVNWYKTKLAVCRGDLHRLTYRDDMGGSGS
jgi:hypothetical protein